MTAIVTSRAEIVAALVRWAEAEGVDDIDDLLCSVPIGGVDMESQAGSFADLLIGYIRGGSPEASEAA